jgi:hypothetical protein
MDCGWNRISAFLRGLHFLVSLEDCLPIELTKDQKDIIFQLKYQHKTLESFLDAYRSYSYYTLPPYNFTEEDKRRLSEFFDESV